MSSVDGEGQVHAASPLSSLSSKATFLQRAYPSAPPSLLHSSFIPSPEEETTIRKTIHDIDTTLSSVDDEVARVHATLTALETYRSTLNAMLASQQASLSLIRRIPPEILSEIFLFASASSAIGWASNSEAHQDNMPWVLCQICSYWRTVAISVPRLWSNICLNLLCASPMDIESIQSFLDICLARSENELLILSFEATTWTPLMRFLNTLVDHSEHWMDVSLTSDMLFSYGVLVENKIRVPNLRRLCIVNAHSATEGQENAPYMPLQAFEDAQNLRELSLTHIIYPLKNFRVPWCQLTHFTSKGNTFREGEFTQIMRPMTNLVAFSTESERIVEFVSTGPVLLRHLRKLSINGEGSCISRTCQFLTTPNLEELSINAVRPFIAEHTTAMIERSGCKLTHLTLHSSQDPDAVDFENADVVWMLATLPSLIHLELAVASAAVVIMPRFVLRDSQSTTQGALFLPELASLVLEDSLCTSALEITEALKSRMVNNMRPGLRSIVLRLLPLTTPGFHELGLLERAAENHGVKIRIFSG